MVRLQTEMAVISTFYDLLEQQPVDWDPKEPQYISVDRQEILDYSRRLEEDSGYAIINAFSERSLDQFFTENYLLFQFDPCAPAQRNGCPAYRLRIENLKSAGPSKKKTGKEFAKLIVRRMVEFLDPAVNYPFDLLEKMKMLDILLADPNENDSEESTVPVALGC